LTSHGVWIADRHQLRALVQGRAEVQGRARWTAMGSRYSPTQLPDPLGCGNMVVSTAGLSVFQTVCCWMNTASSNASEKCAQLNPALLSVLTTQPQPFYHWFLTTHLSPPIIGSRPVVVSIGSNMAFIDVLSLILSLGILSSLRLLLPRNIVPRVSKSFEEAVKAIQRAEAINIPYVSGYQTNLALYACLYTSVVSLPTDLSQSAQPIHTHAYGEP
jgi:hypothetical protein